MSFGQIVLGPPGSGKTVYCHAMTEFLRGIGRYEICPLFTAEYPSSLRLTSDLVR